MRWRMNFISTYLERDVPQLGPRIPAVTLRRLWTMLAHSQGSRSMSRNWRAGLTCRPIRHSGISNCSKIFCWSGRCAPGRAISKTPGQSAKGVH